MQDRAIGVMAPERRRRLVRTAAREFAAAGYEAASLNGIIRDCGLSKSSFYHYVESKRALFDLVVQDLGGELATALRAPAPGDLAGPRFWDDVEDLLHRLLDLARAEPAWTDLGRAFWLPGAPGGDGTPLARALAALHAWLLGALEAGRACGAVRDDLPAPLQADLAAAVLRVLDEWGLQHPEALAGDEGRRLVGVQCAALRRLLEPDDPRAPER
ncbi:TetR/AcrR family transcriptional regulator [Kineococcus arenarius]|uniref:TetR/AcrR family transcriptional regulator n=1 Tax=unclassified Kineococcus TaxID=2621656 RepID=UPI003D7C3E69